MQQLTAKDIEYALLNSVEGLIEQLPDEVIQWNQYESFEEAQLLTSDNGVVITLGNGQKAIITIQVQ